MRTLVVMYQEPTLATNRKRNQSRPCILFSLSDNQVQLESTFDTLRGRDFGIFPAAA
jgi:hypothetical protein